MLIDSLSGVVEGVDNDTYWPISYKTYVTSNYVMQSNSYSHRDMTHSYVCDMQSNSSSEGDMTHSCMCDMQSDS